MIRIIIGYLAIVVAILGTVLVDPFGWLVTREQVAGGQLAAGQVAPEPSLTAAVALGLQAPPASAAAEFAEAELRVVDGGLAGTTAAILAGLKGPAKPAPDAALVAMTEVAVSGLRAATQPRPAGAATLEGLVTAALQQGQSDASIDVLVNEAAARGEVVVPSMLVTSDGKVDTAVLLASLLSEAEMGEGDRAEPDASLSADPLVAALETQDVIYTVTAGDSLGSLALRFYGDSGLYPAIFAANRAKLGTADSIRSGMRLVIPSRAGL